METIDLPITMTSKGTFTLPVLVRKQIGANKKGDKLQLRYTPGSNTVTISAPADFREIQKRVSVMLPNPIPPLPDMNILREQMHEERIRDSIV